MTGYTETLTDPSYKGQILAMTYPLVGNYGVPKQGEKDNDGIPTHFESSAIQPRGLLVHDLAKVASHWNMSITLDEWLHEQGVPGITGIDTRMLTIKLRDRGVSMATLTVSEEPIDKEEQSRGLENANSYSDEMFIQDVSVKDPMTYGDGEKTIVILDVGVKNAILRNVCKMGYKAVCLPWDSKPEDVEKYSPSGVIVSNGPGDPQKCEQTIQTVKSMMDQSMPMLGICLGAQIMGIAGGAKTYKLKYGHRGQNKPCVDLDDGRVYVTSQNHGYCIDPDSLTTSEFDMWFKNTDDGTVEGIKHKTKPCVAVQFHPEASPGPYDCEFVFDRLQNLIGGDDAKA